MDYFLVYIFMYEKDLVQKPKIKKKKGYGQICMENRYRPIYLISYCLSFHVDYGSAWSD